MWAFRAVIKGYPGGVASAGCLCAVDVAAAHLVGLTAVGRFCEAQGVCTLSIDP